MRLADLDAKTANVNVLLLQTPSSKLYMFLFDKIKRKYHINVDSTIAVENKSDLKRVKEVVGIRPPFSEKWFVTVNLDKFNDKSLIEAIKMSSTCVFFVTCSKYGQYKAFKDSLKNYSGVYDYYINYLRRPDFIYLYDAFVPEGNRLTKQLFDYTVTSYSGDIEAVMDLFLHLGQGESIESRKDISEICGIGGNSTEGFIFSLLKPLSGSDKGLNTVLKNRIKAGIDLCDTLGCSTCYNFISKNLYNFIVIKQLLISGVVYKSIRNLPDTFDEKSLARCQKYLWRLKEIPMTSLLQLRSCMGDTWRSDLDFLRFIYKFYYIESLNKLNEMKG